MDGKMTLLFEGALIANQRCLSCFSSLVGRLGMLLFFSDVRLLQIWVFQNSIHRPIRLFFKLGDELNESCFLREDPLESTRVLDMPPLLLIESLLFSTTSFAFRAAERVTLGIARQGRTLDKNSTGNAAGRRLMEVQRRGKSFITARWRLIGSAKGRG